MKHFPRALVFSVYKTVNTILTLFLYFDINISTLFILSTINIIKKRDIHRLKCVIHLYLLLNYCKNLVSLTLNSEQT